MDFENVFYDTKDFTITNQQLGKGFFGTVYVAERKKDHLKCAAKVINILSDIDGKDQMLIMRESVILSKLNHPSIVKYYGANFRSLKDMMKFSPTIITEYMVNKSLKTILDEEETSNSPKDWSPIKKYICLLGISNAMKYLHEHEILHRDLKPENILMDDKFYPKVCDFGLSRCLSKLFSFSLKKSMTGKIGTPLYMVPELLGSDDENKADYGKAVDVYAFAMLAYEIVTGKKPFFENGENISIQKHNEMVMNGERPLFTKDVPDKMITLIQKCWSQKPDDRPSFEGIFGTLSSDFSFSPEDVDEDEINNYLEMINENCNDKNQEKNPFQEQIEQLKKEKIQHQDQINKLKQENNQFKRIFKSQINKSQQEKNEFQDQINKLQQENSQYQDQINKLKQENNQLRGENNSLKSQGEQKSKENDELKNEQKYLNDKISKLQEKINKINFDKSQDIKELKISNEKLQQNIKTKKEELEASQRKLENIFNSNEDFSRALNSMFGTCNERKMKSAVSYLQMSSDKGNCYASYLLRILYESGQGVEKNSIIIQNHPNKEIHMDIIELVIVIY